VPCYIHAMRTLSFIVPFTVLTATAIHCSSDPETSEAKFELTLEVVGKGRVVSEPASFDCAGPTNCGTKTFSGTSLTLKATPEAGYGVSRWTLDGVEKGAEEQLRVDAKSGDKRTVTVLFNPGGAPLPTGDGGTPSDSGITRDAAAGLDCLSVKCTSSQTCCLGPKSSPSACLDSAASCQWPRAIATCTSASDCMAPQVCCFEDLPENAATLSCRATCSGAQLRPLCDDLHPCAPGSVCVTGGPGGVRVCIIPSTEAL
jgi:hypothetical protein